jgi:hypothetical protein
VLDVIVEIRAESARQGDVVNGGPIHVSPGNLPRASQS